MFSLFWDHALFLATKLSLLMSKALVCGSMGLRIVVRRKHVVLLIGSIVKQAYVFATSCGGF